MSTEYSPLINLDYNQSLFNGDGFGGLYQLLPLLFQQLSGMPVHFPGTLPEAGFYNYYDNYRAMLATSANSRSYNQVRAVDVAAQEETISIVAQRIAASLKMPLSADQMKTVRKAAQVLATMGPQFMGIAQQVIKQEGGLEGKDDETILNALSAATTFLDATYGAVGSRLPFYSTAKQAMARHVPIQEQDALLEETVHRLFPLDADGQHTGGLTATETAALLPNMVRMGVNPLNTQTAEMQTLIQEQAAQGFSKLSAPEQERLTQAQAALSFSRIDTQSSRAKAKKAWADEVVQGLSGDITSEDVATYANMREILPFLGQRLRSTGLTSLKGVDVNNLDMKQIHAIKTDLEQEATDITNSLNRFKEGSAQYKRQQARLRDIQRLTTDWEKYEEVAEKFVNATGNLKTNVTEEINERQTQLYIANLENELKSRYGAHMTDSGKQLLREALPLRSILENTVKGLEFNLIESTREEDQKRRADYIKELQSTYAANPEIMKLITDYAITTDDKGLSMGQRYKNANTFIRELMSTQVSEETEKTINQYANVLAEGDQDKIAEFRAKNRDVTSRFDAIIASRGADKTLSAEARSASRLYNAIAGTGGGTIGGRAIQGVSQMSQVMDMLTQMTGRRQFTAEQLENYWATVAFGMNQSGTNIDEVSQMSKIAADAATYVGGDRGLAAMAGIELGLGARQIGANAGIDPTVAATLAAQAAGKASNSLTSRAVNGLAFEVIDRDLNDYKNITDEERRILTKIQKRESLTGEEASYLNNNIYGMMGRMGLDADYQTRLMSRNFYGDEGKYAIQVGAQYELDTAETQHIRRATIGDFMDRNESFRGLNDEKRNKFIDAAYGTLTENLRLRNDPAGYMKALRQKLIKEKFTQKEIDAYLKGIDSHNMLSVVNDVLTGSGAMLGADDTGAANAFNMSRQLKQDELKALGSISKSLPFSDKKSIQAIIKAFKDPNSTLAEIITAGITGDYTTEKLDSIASSIATMGIYMRNEDILQEARKKGVNVTDAQAAFRDLTSQVEDAQEAGELLAAHQKVVHSKEGKALLESGKAFKELTEEEQKKLKEAGITEDQFDKARRFRAETEGMVYPTVQALQDAYDITTGYVKGRVTENTKPYESTPQSISEQNITSPAPPVSPKPRKKKSKSKSEGEKTAEGATSSTDSEKAVEIPQVGPLEENGETVVEIPAPASAPSGEAPTTATDKATTDTTAPVAPPSELTMNKKSGQSPGDAIYVIPLPVGHVVGDIPTMSSSV